MTRPLNHRQERFCEEYLVDGNATQAAARAGYSRKTAAIQGWELLQKPKIKERLQVLRQEQSRRVQIHADRVLAEVAKIAFADLGDILDFSGGTLALRPANTIHEDARRALASVKVRRQVEGSGEESRQVELIEFRLASKLEALEKLGKHLGIFREQVDLAGELPVRIVQVEVVRPDSPHGPHGTTAAASAPDPDGPGGDDA